MAGNIGRADIVKKNNVVVAGVREKSLSWAGEAIDVTSDEDNGIRKLLDEYGQQQLSLSFSGVFKGSTTFRSIALTAATSGAITDITYEFENGDVISGPVLLVGYEEGAPYKDATIFSVTLEYSDTWTFTPV